MFPKDTNILIVDDMTTMRKLVAKALKEIGFTRIAEAPDGKAAFDKLKSAQSSGEPFQLVISDWNMPVMTGIQLLRAVREDPETQATPFVLLTAESEKTQILEAAKLRVNGYMIKPFTSQQLADKLNSVGTATQAQSLKKAS